MATRTSFLLLALLGFVSACSDSGGSPISPSQQPAPSTPSVTRVLRFEGDLNFGDVAVGASVNRVLRILNGGNAALTVSGLVGPAGYAADWLSGTIQPNQWQDVTIRFTPTSIQSYSGTLTVNADQTSGTNTIALTARGARERWSRTGSGDTVFDMPTDVARVRIIGTFTGRTSNFIVRIGGRVIVNEIIGTSWSSTRYDGTLLSGGGGVVAITNSSGVSWSFEEIR